MKNNKLHFHQKYFLFNEDKISLFISISICRNFLDLRFPHIEESERLLALANKINLNFPLNNFSYFKKDKFKDIEIKLFQEKFIIGKNFNNKKSLALSSNQEQDLLYVFNENSHLKILGFSNMKNLKKKIKNLKEIERKIGDKNKYAFDTDFGFLSSNPFKSGLGVFLKAYLHLPALRYKNLILKKNEDLKMMGFKISGVFSDNGFYPGDFYVLENFSFLGKLKDLEEKFIFVLNSIIIEEENLRVKILNEEKILWEDKIYRAYSLLKEARLMGFFEGMNLLSILKLGEDLKLLNIKKSFMNKSFFSFMPNHIKFFYEKSLKEKSEDEIRAQISRKLFINN